MRSSAAPAGANKFAELCDQATPNATAAGMSGLVISAVGVHPTRKGRLEREPRTALAPGPPKPLQIEPRSFPPTWLQCPSSGLKRPPRGKPLDSNSNVV